MFRRLDTNYIPNLQPTTEVQPEQTQSAESTAAPAQPIVEAKPVSGGPNAYAARMSFDPSAFLQYTLLNQLNDRMRFEPVPPTNLAEVILQGTAENTASGLEVRREHLPFIEADPPIDRPPLEMVPGRNRPPLFVKDGTDVQEVDMNDVAQGGIGDCFVLASIAAVARHSPEMIKNMIRDNGDGSYTVFFKQGAGVLPNPIEVPITVTADFPGGITGGQHAAPGDAAAWGKKEIWPLIIEKAYAEYVGGYSNISSGGHTEHVLQSLTGRTSTNIMASLPFVGESSTFFDSLKSAFDSGKPVVFSTPDVNPRPMGPSYGLVQNHAYALSKMYTDANGRQWVELYNPWGGTHPKPIPFDEMMTLFERGYING